MPKSKCPVCNKKVPLTLQGTPCQCGKEFCLLHRLPESHHCEFNHRAQHLEKADKQIESMKCVNEKIDKL